MELLGRGGGVRDIALYYPGMNVRDEAWLKAAALYWPRLAVMVPLGERRNGESRAARVLRDELNFLIDINPDLCAIGVAGKFLELIRRNGDALLARYGWLTDFQPRDVDSHRLGSVLAPKTTIRLGNTMVRAGLARWGDGRRSLAMHPRLASVYMSALADRVAQANDLVAITDQPQLHGALNGWTLETLTWALLAGDSDDRTAAATTEDVSAMYAAVAIQTVVPVGIEHVPVERIVRARRTLAAEFDAFRDHVDSLNSQLAELARIEDPAILRARLELLVERDLQRPTAELEGGLRQLGLEPARAVLGMTSLELPATAALGASGVGLPVAAGQAGMAAAQLIASSVRARQQAQERRRSAAGYLLGLRKELNPSGVVDRVRRLFRRASGPPGIP